ncbi:hypothetical protein RND81_06G059800 [Saponaria officinalis]|uniref:TTF-type domain-containing protein n=1 Tax=Saponaria officinalis TaxID=3572 RepID=A0AAW1K7T8_SAPOF
MERYFKKVSHKPSNSDNLSGENPLQNQSTTNVSAQNTPLENQSCENVCVENVRIPVDINSLPSDPADRIPIKNYHVDERDMVRRAYLQNKPIQPREHDFPYTDFSGTNRCFKPQWFDKYNNWLEYSKKKDAAFCLCCYLFKSETIGHGGGDVFSTKGFKAWNKSDRFRIHVGGPNSAHNKVVKMCEDLMNEKQSIRSVLDKQSRKEKSDYRTRLNASIDCTRLLLSQGMAFRGHDEHEFSRNKGNFIEVLEWYSTRVDKVANVVLKNAPKNLKLTSPEIQKDIVKACAMETTKAVIEDLNGDYFSILVDESKDKSHKEQMAIVLRYVDRRGMVIERFIALVRLYDTSALSLEDAIVSELDRHSLSLSRIRGQGYDGASNMQGEINGLKTLVVRETASAYCINCFAHQLQLTLVAVAKNHDDVAWFFEKISNMQNIVGASYKRMDLLREKQAEKVEEALRVGELQSARGLNQELGLKRPAIFGITNELNVALQRKEQDILNAMLLVGVAKERLQVLRDEQFQRLMDDVHSFCEKHDILAPKMDDMHVIRGKSRRRVSKFTNEHYYRVECFYTIIDMILQEINGRFSELNTDLLLGVAYFNLVDSFSNFDKKRLIRLAELYPNKFSDIQVDGLGIQLETFIVDMRRDERFFDLKGIVDLSRKMVETKKHNVYPEVYLLLKLLLLLPFATATAERTFSAMNFIKNGLRNKMGDDFLNDCMVTYIEKDVFASLSSEAIMRRFQNMKSRRQQLY